MDVAEKFNNPPIVQSGIRHGRQYFRLEKDLQFVSTFNSHGGVKAVVPAGTETDFASVPRLLWWLFPPIGRYMRAACLHDALYANPNVSRFLADALFREGMNDLAVPWYVRLPIYYAVRIFGGLARTKPKAEERTLDAVIEERRAEK